MQDHVLRSDTTATEGDESNGGEAAAAASEDDASETFSSLIRGPEQEAELRDLIRLARSAAAAIELEPCSTITALGSNQRPLKPS